MQFWSECHDQRHIQDADEVYKVSGTAPVIRRQQEIRCGRSAALHDIQMITAGIIFLGLGAFLTLVNMYLSFLRYPIHLARGGTRETFRWVSGVPLAGSLLLWISISLLPSTGLKWLAGILSIFDIGGIHWFIGTMWWTGQWGDLFSGRTDGE